VKNVNLLPIAIKADGSSIYMNGNALPSGFIDAIAKSDNMHLFACAKALPVNAIKDEIEKNISKSLIACCCSGKILPEDLMLNNASYIGSQEISNNVSSYYYTKEGLEKLGISLEGIRASVVKKNIDEFMPEKLSERVRKECPLNLQADKRITSTNIKDIIDVMMSSIPLDHKDLKSEIEQTGLSQGVELEIIDLVNSCFNKGASFSAKEIGKKAAEFMIKQKSIADTNRKQRLGGGTSVAPTKEDLRNLRLKCFEIPANYKRKIPKGSYIAEETTTITNNNSNKKQKTS
jgi:hypothetical protein